VKQNSSFVSGYGREDFDVYCELLDLEGNLDKL